MARFGRQRRPHILAGKSEAAGHDSNHFIGEAVHENPPAQDAGAVVTWHWHARDNEVELERAMRDGLAAADVLITSGGVSMGTRDLIKPLLEKIATIQFGRVSFKPGKPLTINPELKVPRQRCSG